MDYTDLYNSIKSKITNLYKTPENTKYMLGVEHFTLPDKTFEFNDTEFQKEILDRPSDPIAKLALKYNILPSEIENVIKNFDSEPLKLSDVEKTLRKKYLNIILSIMLDEIRILKDKIQSNLKYDTKSKDIILENYDPTVNTIIRIVKLLINEIDGPTICPTCPAQLVCPTTICPTCPTCPDCPAQLVCPTIKPIPYIIAISILVFLLIIFIILFLMKK